MCLQDDIVASRPQPAEQPVDLAAASERPAGLVQACAAARRAQEALDPCDPCEAQYQLLFKSHPFPMWAFDRRTLRFLAVNEAAIRQYGFTEQEFLAMTIAEIRPPEDVPALIADVGKLAQGLQARGAWRHRRKNGEVFDVEVVCHSVEFRGVDAMFVSACDVTERKRAEATMRLQSSALDAAANTIVITDTDGIIQWANPAFTRLTGYSIEEAIGRNPGSLLRSGKHERSFYENLWRTIRAGQVWTGEITNRRKDGQLYDEEMTIAPVVSQAGKVTNFIEIKQDITERKRAQEALRQAEERYRATFEDALVGIFQSSLDGRLLNVNRTLAQMHGFNSPEEMLARITNPAQQLFVDPGRRDELMRELLEHGTVHRAEVQLFGKDRTSMWALVNLRLAHNSSGEILFLEGIVEDITDRKAAEERNLFLAYYDALTGLPQRALLLDRLDNALAGARRRNDRVAVLFLDLDRFNIYNDSLGHEVGDLLLKDVAERLKGCAREQDTVARFGGDEFVLVLNSVKDAAAAGHAAERIMKSLVRDFTIQGRCANISCSMGISLFPEHGADGATLIKNAGVAMYAAKDDGRNNFRVFTEEMRNRAEERSAIESNLRRALERKEFFLLYQPQMEIESGQITGVEALIRWQHPELGLVMPDKFISIAENCGLMLPIGEWVLRTACAQARRWQKDGLLAGPVAVNVSAVQFRQEGFVATIRKVLLETGLPPDHLELELTEGLLLSNADVTSSVLRELQEMGVKLAIDDFGTGYSSLSYLRQFPVSKLKIDRSFVRDLNANSDDGVIIVAILGMAKSLKLRVIAEGVEDEAQLSFLRDHDCDEIQGYYFSRPIAAAEVTGKLTSGRASARVLAMPARA